MKCRLHHVVLLRLGCLKSRHKGSLKLKHLLVPATREQQVEDLGLSQLLQLVVRLQPAAVQLEVVPVAVAVAVVAVRGANKRTPLDLLRLITTMESQSGRGALPTLFSMLPLLIPANQ